MISTQLVLQSQSNRIHLLAGKYQLFLLSTEVRIEEKTSISRRLKKEVEAQTEDRNHSFFLLPSWKSVYSAGATR